MRVGQDGVAAAGAGDDRPAGGLLGQIDDKFGRAVVAQGKGELAGGLGGGGEAGGRQETGKDDLLHNRTRMVQKR